MHNREVVEGKGNEIVILIVLRLSVPVAEVFSFLKMPAFYVVLLNVMG